MSDDMPPLEVSGADAGDALKTQGGNETKSPPAPPGSNLSGRERKVWDYICARLREAGLEHLTCGLTISIVVRTYIRWVDSEKYLAEVEKNNGGTYYITTPNGHVQPHQAFYVVKSLKKELREWLPECCLTLPSVATARQKMGSPAPQDDLFDAIANHGASHPSAG